jgi:hypothetical protein
MPAPSEVRTASAVTRTFFEHLDRSSIPSKKLSEKSGIHVNTLYCWRTGKAGASVPNLEAALAVLGFELVIRPMTPTQEETV